MKDLPFPDEIRVTQINDEGPIPCFFIRFADPVACLTTNWNYVPSAHPLVERIVPHADVLVAQRAFSKQSQWIVEDAKDRGVPVIYELDDFFLELPPQSCTRITEERKDAIRRMLACADLVTCSTRPLAQALGSYNSNIRVLDNYALPVTLARLDTSPRDVPHVGIVNTDYFKLIDQKLELFAALREAIETLGYQVTFPGTIDPLMRELQSQYPSHVKLVPTFLPRRHLIELMIEYGINVAVVPLDDNQYHRFKSDIKFFDWGSAAIPGIYNNSRIYQRVIHQKNGFLCDGTYDGWLEGLRYFADSKARHECGMAAHAEGQKRTLETYSREMADAFLSVIGNPSNALEHAASA
jgi:hypothetical protein